MRSFSCNEAMDLLESYKRLECFAVELAVRQMSDRDIEAFENILIKAVAALQLGDMKICAISIRVPLAEDSNKSWVAGPTER